jgi:integrase
MAQNLYNFTLTNGSSALKLDEFAAHLDGIDYSQRTRQSYIDGLRDFHRHGFTEVTELNEYKYRDMLMAEGKKGKTVNARIHALNAYNKWIGLPTIKEIKINEDPFVRGGMELNDFQRLTDRLLKDGNYRWYIIIKLLAGTGMRIGEAVQVTFGDFRQGSCTVYGKGNKPRTVYFSHILRETLFFFIQNKPDNEKMIPYSTAYVREALSRIKERYGMECKVNPHEYRRFFAREMFEATHDIALLKGLLGHQDVKTTSHYIRKTEAAAMKMYARSQNW